MEFIRVKKYTDPCFNEKKSKFKDELATRITAYYYCPIDQVVTVGQSSGQIMQFRRRGFDQKNIMESKEYETVRYPESKNGHKGEIGQLLYERISGSTFIFTGSADRTIKLWDTDPKSRQCIQTLNGHNGTITALAFGRNALYSASNDKTFKVWKQEHGREFLYNPWFVVVQIIYDFSMKKQINHQCYVTCFLVKSPHFALYAGDTDGSLHLLKYEDGLNPGVKPKKQIKIDKSYFNFHRLHAIQIIEIEKDSAVFSIGYDQKVMGFGETGGKFFTHKNPHKCLFTSIQWSSQHQELVVSDEQGRIYFMNISSDKQVLEFKLYDVKILSLELLDSIDTLVVVTEAAIDVLKIKRGVRSGNLLDQHKGPIVGLIVIEYPMIKSQQIEPDKLISASLDNTIRIWDPKDMSCTVVMENSEKSEISSMHYLFNANLLATGHDNGDIKLWNVEIGTSITLNQSLSKSKHVNNICALTSHIFPAGEEYLFSSGYDGKINIWEIFERKQKSMAGQILPQLKQSVLANKKVQPDTIGNEILCLLFDSNTNCIVAAGNKAQIYFIEMYTYEHRIIFTGHKDSINCLVMDGRILFSGSDDQTIRLWDTVSCQFLTEFQAHEEGVLNLLILPLTGHLVSTGQGGFLVWDYPNQNIVARFTKSEKVKHLVYLKNEQAIFAGTDENNIYSYPIDEMLGNQAVSKLELQTNEDNYKIAKGKKKIYIVSDDGFQEERNLSEHSPHKQSRKKTQYIQQSDMTIESLNNNDYLKQIEEKNKQVLQELMQK